MSSAASCRLLARQWVSPPCRGLRTGFCKQAGACAEPFELAGTAEAGSEMFPVGLYLRQRLRRPRSCRPYPGAPKSLYYVVHNPYDANVYIGLGATIRNSDSGQEFHDSSCDEQMCWSRQMAIQICRVVSIFPERPARRI